MRRDLVERARRGDREAFAQLAAEDVDRLHAIATLVLRDSDLAQDAVQETLIRSWRQLPALRDVERFEAWIYRILMRAAADEFGRRRRYQASVRQATLAPTVSDAERQVEDRDELERGFRRLSMEHRAVIVLHQYLGLPIPEVAQVLGIRPGTAKSRYHHAMAALRAALDAEARRPHQGEVTA
jgi:RNA polymerase sigma-70 factor (ECF subfamily)